jgi:hypothetical protein
VLSQLVGSPREEIKSGASTVEIDPAAVREQLERLIGDRLFSQSRRYSSLLRYLVEEALNGHAGQLKERTVGVDVFGRTPTYDTNADPVVRTTAAQLRHRIAQYYSQPGRESEIRILLPPGAYVPEFSEPSAHNPAEASLPAFVEDLAPPAPATSTAPLALRGAAARLSPDRRWLTAGAGILIAACILVSVLALRLTAPDASLREFWGPVWDKSGSVLLCIGEPRRQAVPNSGGSVAAPQPGSSRAVAANPGPTVAQSLGANSVAWPDAMVLAQLSGLARVYGQSIRLRKSSAIAFADLRDSPSILVGGFNNQWILRLGKDLRFRFMAQQDPEMHWIQDQQRPDQRDWKSQMSAPYSGFLTDYGLITRVLDPDTGKTVVVASGIAAYGTMAAGEFLTSEKYIQMLARRAPRGWQRKNLQVVISTEVIGGNAGPPKILATHFW